MSAALISGACRRHHHRADARARPTRRRYHRPLGTRHQSGAAARQCLAQSRRALHPRRSGAGVLQERPRCLCHHRPDRYGRTDAGPVSDRPLGGQLGPRRHAPSRSWVATGTRRSTWMTIPGSGTSLPSRPPILSTTTTSSAATTGTTARSRMAGSAAIRTSPCADLAERIAREGDYDYDVAEYYVERHYDYPRFVCYDCHTYASWRYWDPYSAYCSRFRIVIYDDWYYYPYRQLSAAAAVIVRPYRPGPRYVFKDSDPRNDYITRVEERPRGQPDDRRPTIDRDRTSADVGGRGASRHRSPRGAGRPRSGPGVRAAGDARRRRPTAAPLRGRAAGTPGHGPRAPPPQRTRPSHDPGTTASSAAVRMRDTPRRRPSARTYVRDTLPGIAPTAAAMPRPRRAETA